MPVIVLIVAGLAGLPLPSAVCHSSSPGVCATVQATVQEAAVKAQGGRVEGRVIDPASRAGIIGVEIRLDGRAAGVTGEGGMFVLAGVSAGRHRVDAGLPGFDRSAVLDVLVEEGRTAVVEIEYALSSVTEVVGALQGAGVAAGEVSRPVLTGSDIAGAVGGLEDVSRALQVRPGVLASQDDRNDLIVRGGGPIETGVVVDGFEVPTASHFAQPGSSGGGISLFAPAVVGRATLHAGGFSVAHGERASSMLDIDLRAPRAKGVGGVVSAGAGGIMALGEGQLPSGAWLVAARRSILEVAFHREELQAVPRYHDVVARGVTTAGRHQLRLFLLAGAESADVTSTPSADLDDMHEEQQVVVAGAGVRSEWGAQTRSSFSVSRSDSRLDAYGGEDDSVEGFAQSQEVEWRVRGELRRRVGRLELLAGATVKRADVRFDMENGGYRNPWGNLVAAVFVHQSGSLTDTAAYLELSAVPHPTLRATFAGRGDRWGGSRATTFSPRAVLEYKPVKALSLSVGGGVYRQAIPYVWSQSDPANQGLEPIRSVQGNAGLQAEGKAGRVAVEGFLKRYQGYPVDPTAPARVLVSAATDFETPFVGRLVPGGRVKVEGVDTIVTSPSWRGLELSASASFWHVSQRGLDGVWRRAEYDVRQQFRGWLSWRPSTRWHASALWRYASGRPYTPYDMRVSVPRNTGRYDKTRINAATGPAYHRLDARVERTFSARRAMVVAFAELDNLYNRDNLYIYTWSRSARAPKPVYQWGITPVAGIRVEF